MFIEMIRLLNSTAFLVINNALIFCLLFVEKRI